MAKQKKFNELTYWEEVKACSTEQMKSLGSELYEIMKTKEQLEGALEELGKLSTKFYVIWDNSCGPDHVSLKWIDKIDTMIDGLYDIRDEVEREEIKLEDSWDDHFSQQQRALSIIKDLKEEK